MEYKPLEKFTDEELGDYNWPSCGEIWRRVSEFKIVDIKDPKSMSTLFITSNLKLLCCSLVPRPGSKASFSNTPYIKVKVRVDNYALDYGTGPNDPNRGLWFQLGTSEVWYKPEMPDAAFESIAKFDMTLVDKFMSLYDKVIKRSEWTGDVFVCVEKIEDIVPGDDLNFVYDNKEFILLHLVSNFDSEKSKILFGSIQNIKPKQFIRKNPINTTRKKNIEHINEDTSIASLIKAKADLNPVSLLSQNQTTSSSIHNTKPVPVEPSNNESSSDEERAIDHKFKMRIKSIDGKKSLSASRHNVCDKVRSPPTIYDEATLSDDDLSLPVKRPLSNSSKDGMQVIGPDSKQVKTTDKEKASKIQAKMSIAVPAPKIKKRVDDDSDFTPVGLLSNQGVGLVALGRDSVGSKNPKAKLFDNNRRFNVGSQANRHLNQQSSRPTTKFTPGNQPALNIKRPEHGTHYSTSVGPLTPNSYSSSTPNAYSTQVEQDSGKSTVLTRNTQPNAVPLVRQGSTASDMPSVNDSIESRFPRVRFADSVAGQKLMVYNYYKVDYPDDEQGEYSS